MANLMTGCRILCSLTLLCFPVFSPMFYMMYLLTGLTDMIDGIVARKTNTVSEFGSQLDTMADLIFIVMSLVKFLPVLDIPKWLLMWMVIIGLIKISNFVSGLMIYKTFLTEHTLMNKITGFSLFVLPFTLSFIHLQYGAIVVCIMATVAAIQEGHYIRTGRNVNE